MNIISIFTLIFVLIFSATNSFSGDKTIIPIEQPQEQSSSCCSSLRTCSKSLPKYTLMAFEWFAAGSASTGLLANVIDYSLFKTDHASPFIRSTNTGYALSNATVTPFCASIISLVIYFAVTDEISMWEQSLYFGATFLGGLANFMGWYFLSHPNDVHFENVEDVIFGLLAGGCLLQLVMSKIYRYKLKELMYSAEDLGENRTWGEYMRSFCPGRYTSLG